MTTHLTSSPSSDFAAILAEAATSSASHPTSQAVTNALLQAEKDTKQQHRQYPLTSLLGHWRLCFTTSGKVNLQQGEIKGKKGFYVPKFIPAQISFIQPADSEDLAIQNQIRVGLVSLQVTGPARYLEKKNLLAFDFTRMQLQILGKTVYQGALPGRKVSAKPIQERSISRLAFFTFFWITEDFIAARGRGGGLAIWVREPN